MNQLLAIILTGGLSAACATALGNVCVAHIRTKSEVHEACMESLELQVASLTEELRSLKAEQIASNVSFRNALRVELQDRIKYLSRSYIKAGAISYDDRRDLIKMHEIYHDTLGGNGDLDHLMGEVKRLGFE